MMNAAIDWLQTDEERIGRALSVAGGHLSVGWGGYVLYYAKGTTLSGYDVEHMKAACVAAGLPVIDSRCLDFELALQLAVRSPMIAVGEPPDAQPWHGLSHAPLQYVAEFYRAAGAEVINLPAAKI